MVEIITPKSLRCNMNATILMERSPSSGIVMEVSKYFAFLSRENFLSWVNIVNLWKPWNVFYDSSAILFSLSGGLWNEFIEIGKSIELMQASSLRDGLVLFSGRNNDWRKTPINTISEKSDLKTLFLVSMEWKYKFREDTGYEKWFPKTTNGQI